MFTFRFAIFSETAILVFRNEYLRTVDLTVWKHNESNRVYWFQARFLIFSVFVSCFYRKGPALMKKQNITLFFNPHVIWFNETKY